MRSVLFLAAALLVQPAAAQTYSARAVEIRVVDGDTISVNGAPVRIVGLDTPEIYSPKCASERALGYQAAGRLLRLMNSRNVRVEMTGKVDKYRRALARVWAGPDDVAWVLIREGLARPNHGEHRQPWC